MAIIDGEKDQSNDQHNTDHNKIILFSSIGRPDILNRNNEPDSIGNKAHHKQEQTYIAGWPGEVELWLFHNPTIFVWGYKVGAVGIIGDNRPGRPLVVKDPT